MGGKKKGEEEIWKKMNLIKEIKKRIGVKKKRLDSKEEEV